MNRLSCGLVASVAFGFILSGTNTVQGVELGLNGEASDSQCMPAGLLLQYTLHNAAAADTTNAEDLWSGGVAGLNLTGAGVVVGIWDGGSILATHQEFASVSITNNNSATATHVHSTHVAGTIAAQGIVANAKGMASGVTIQGWDYDYDLDEMGDNAAGLHISNHSYGYTRGWTIYELSPGVYYDMWYSDYSISGATGEDYLFGKYDATSAEIDDILADNPNYLSVWSAGNDRNDGFTNAAGNGQFIAFFSTAPTSYVQNLGNGWYIVSTSTYTAPGVDGNNGTGYDSLANGGQTAKNTLVVGAINDHTSEPHNGSTIVTAAFSSYGGTDDGRLGVDVVANGVSLYSTSDAGTASYTTMSGTSMAAPNATGTLALLHEHYQNLAGGSIPTSATQKGYAIHTATDVTNASIGGRVGPDYATGYGLLNGLAAAEFLTNAFDGDGSHHLFENTLANSTTFSLTGMMATDGELKVTLVWTDPAGAPQSNVLDDRTSVLVNNLDLWLTDGSSAIYYPWILDIENPANAATTGVNNLDVVEQVSLTGITLGSLWDVHVGHQGNLLGGSQNYSLLISGLAVAVPEPASLCLLVLGAMLLAWRRPRRRI